MATNPSNGSVRENANAQLHNIVNHDASKGATVHSFDPDASPQQKATAVGKQRDKLESATKHKQDGSAQGEKGALLFCLVNQVTSPDIYIRVGY